MKLKQMLDQQSLDILLSGKENFITKMNEQFPGLLDEDGNLVGSFYQPGGNIMWQQTRPFVQLGIASMILVYLKSKDKDYYDKIFSAIEKQRGEADINVYELAKKIPGLGVLSYVIYSYLKKNSV